MDSRNPAAITAADITWDLPADDEPIETGDDVAVLAIVEAQSYRVLAQQALHALHRVTVERDILLGQRELDRRMVREKAA